MRYAEIKNGVCVNIMLSSAEFAQKKGWVELPDRFGVGDLFDGETWTSARIEIETEPTEEDDTASMLIDHEYRLTLLELGLTE